MPSSENRAVALLTVSFCKVLQRADGRPACVFYATLYQIIRASSSKTLLHSIACDTSRFANDWCVNIFVTHQHFQISKFASRDCCHSMDGLHDSVDESKPPMTFTFLPCELKILVTYTSRHLGVLETEDFFHHITFITSTRRRLFVIWEYMSTVNTMSLRHSSWTT